MIRVKMEAMNAAALNCLLRRATASPVTSRANRSICFKAQVEVGHG